MSTILEKIKTNTVALKKYKENDFYYEEFIVFCKQIPQIYDVLFTSKLVAGQLKDDLNNSINTINDVYQNNKTKGLFELVENEIKERGLSEVRTDKKSAVIGLLWLSRAFRFMCGFLRMVVETDEDTSSCAYKTYVSVLKPYHGWFASKAVGMTMRFTPTKTELKKNFGLDNGNFQQKMTEFISVFDSLFVQRLHSFILKMEINFPDKV